MTEYDTVKQVGKHISTESATPTSEGAGPQRPQNFCDPYVVPNGLTYGDEIWYSNMHGGSVFLGGRSATPPFKGAGPSVPKFL